MHMDIPSITPSQVTGGISILKRANQQPELAAELLRRTLEAGDLRAKQPQAQPVNVSELTGTGTIINTTA